MVSNCRIDVFAVSVAIITHKILPLASARSCYFNYFSWSSRFDRSATISHIHLSNIMESHYIVCLPFPRFPDPGVIFTLNLKGKIRY